MPIDVERAGAAVDRVARALKLDRIAAAAGILRVANANMERAIRVVSVERGYDPRDFALVAFGGSGGLHACEIARELGMRTVIVPEQAGVLSALGMLMADAVRDYAAGALGRADLEKQFAMLERHARRESPSAQIERAADLRYRGQSYELNVPWDLSGQLAGAARAFHREHARVYGYATPEREIEVVTIRVRARQRLAKPKLTRGTYRKGLAEIRRVWVEGAWRKIPALPRAQVSPRRAAGPALILDYGSTTLVPPRWLYRNDRSGNLIISHDRTGRRASA
jgi:N-methylhydantoinase A